MQDIHGLVGCMTDEAWQAGLFKPQPRQTEGTVVSEGGEHLVQGTHCFDVLVVMEVCDIRCMCRVVEYLYRY